MMKYITISVAAYLLLLVPATASAATTSAYEQFVAQIQALEERIAELSELVEQSATAAVSQTDIFTVSVDDTLVHSSNTISTPEAARIVCSQYAFNAANMWQTVRCEFDGETIYNDVFVAG